MAVYIITFALSCILLFQSQHLKRKWNIWSISGLILPCIVASFRSTDVGTDTEMYHYIFESCRELTLHDFISNNNLNVEIFFYFASQLGKKISGFSFVLFIYQGLNVYFLYDISYSLKKSLSIWIVFLLYYIFLYSYSLNIVRQITCVMYVVWISKFLVQNNRMKFILGCILGFIFHSTVIVGGGIVWMCYLIYNTTGFKQKQYIFISICGMIVFSIIISKLADFLTLAEIGQTARYGNYLGKDTSYIGKTDLLVRIIFLTLIVYLGSTGRIRKNLFYSFAILLYFEIILFFCGKYSNVIFRLSLYPTAFDILIVPYLINLKIFKRYSQLILKTSLIIFGTVYWIYTIVLNNTNDIIPYSTI